MKETETNKKDGFEDFLYVEEDSLTSSKKEEQDPSLKAVKISTSLLSSLTMVCGILIAVFGALLSYRSRLFSQWGIGGVFSLALFGALIFLWGLVDLLNLLLADRKSKILLFLRKALPYLTVAGFFTAFSTILLRPEAIDSYLHTANALSYVVSSCWIVIAFSWVLAALMPILETLFAKNAIVLSFRYVLMGLSLYLPLVFYPLLKKSYVLSPSTPGILLLVFGAIAMDLSALFLALKGKKTYAFLFRFFFLLSLLLLSSALLFYGLGMDRLSL